MNILRKRGIDNIHVCKKCSMRYTTTVTEHKTKVKNKEMEQNKFKAEREVMVFVG